MGVKTVGNDLDNARIAFDSVRLPHSAMLNRYADVNPETGVYEEKAKGIRTMEMIGQRLFSGRIAVAQAALAYRRKLYEMTRAYSDEKRCWSPVGNPVLSEIPQLRSIYAEADRRADELESFLNVCESKLNICLTEGCSRRLISQTPLPWRKCALLMNPSRCASASSRRSALTHSWRALVLSRWTFSSAANLQRATHAFSCSKWQGIDCGCSRRMGRLVATRILRPRMPCAQTLWTRWRSIWKKRWGQAGIL